LSQERLARELGLTFQQIQKYERGTNRISAGRLFRLASALDVPVSYFYVGLDPAQGPTGRRAEFGVVGPPSTGLAEDPVGYEGDILSSRESLDLLRAYYGIRSPKLRRRVFDLIRTIESDDVAEVLFPADRESAAEPIKPLRRRRRQG
jgi:transcriptional regulator with XRE-family HTH domain